MDEQKIGGISFEKKAKKKPGLAGLFLKKK
jgi:hypothetical protein